MQNLATMFPKQFETQEAINAWASVHRDALGKHEGPRLAKAFESCMAAWKYNNPPKPADIAGHLPAVRSKASGKDPVIEALHAGEFEKDPHTGRPIATVDGRIYGFTDALRIKAKAKGRWGISEHERRVLEAWRMR